jgi:hypothetical protein
LWGKSKILNPESQIFYKALIEIFAWELEVIIMSVYLVGHKVDHHVAYVESMVVFERAA